MEENLSIFLAGFSSFMLAFCVFCAAPKILDRLSNQYGQLDAEKRVVADNTLMSGVLSLLLGSVASYIIFFVPEVYPTRLRYNCLLLRQGIAACLGYTMADTLMMIPYKHLASKVLLMHHAVTMVSEPAGIFCTSAPWMVNTFLLYEASGPFVHTRILLNLLGEKKSRPYTINGVLMTSVFFLCRVAIIPIYWRAIYTFYIEGSFPQIDWPVYYVMLYGRIFFDVLNAFWFYKMVSYMWLRPKGAAMESYQEPTQI